MDLLCQSAISRGAGNLLHGRPTALGVMSQWRRFRGAQTTAGRIVARLVVLSLVVVLETRHNA